LSPGAETEAPARADETVSADPIARDASGVGQQTTRRQIAGALRCVIDPEVGLNIVDLGLIYGLRIEEGEVTVVLTMTTPACPMSGYIKGQVGDVLSMVPGIRRGIIELVWSPAWSPHMIDRDIRGMTFPMPR
jgi:metal-sulfur cluster biosynthetic enzyme